MVAYPRILLVRQNLPDRRIIDIPGEVHNQLSRSQFASRVRPGARVAIGVGSRGITGIAVIVRSVVDYWKAAGARPFLFPAMGSHGAASAEGQADVLAHYGITEQAMGCPVVSRLEVVSVGKTPEGIEAFIDKAAFESDGIMLVGRVKWHTDFAGKIESGLFKMMAIGLGKFAGARNYHAHAYNLGLEQVIRSVGRQVLGSGKILGGLAILEDAHHNTAKLDAVPVEIMEQREEENLALARSWMARIPVPELDLLIVDQMGKNISGAGFDTKVVNRGINGEYNPWPDTVKVHRLFIRELSELSYGNATGIGMADITTDRLVNSINWPATQINVLTSNPVASARTPLHFATDEECLRRIWPTVGRFDPKELTIGWIRNTLELDLIALSETLRPLIESQPELEVVGEPAEIEFNAGGNLVEFEKLLAGQARV